MSKVFWRIEAAEFGCNTKLKLDQRGGDIVLSGPHFKEVWATCDGVGIPLRVGREVCTSNPLRGLDEPEVFIHFWFATVNGIDGDVRIRLRRRERKCYRRRDTSRRILKRRFALN